MKKISSILVTGILFFLMTVSFSGCSDDEVIEQKKENPVQNEDPVNPVNQQPTPISRSKYFGKMVTTTGNLTMPVLTYLDSVSKTNENFMVSPLSLAEALGMLANGVQGSALNELKKVLGAEGLSIEDVDSAFQSINSHLECLGGVNIKCANSMWFDTNLRVNSPFIETNKKFFDAEVRVQDLSTEQTMNDINKWCSEKTNGNIDNLLTEPLEGQIAVLFNALYFNGKWDCPFKTDSTKTEQFHSADGTISDVQMMSQNNIALAKVTDKYDILVKEYQAYLKMDIILPHEGESLSECLKDVVFDNKWANWALDPSWHSYDVSLKMPKFNLEYNKSLKQCLEAFGVNGIFSPVPEEETFLPMTPDGVLVSDVSQATTIKVDEEGTEAAAVTKVETCTASGVGGETPQYSHLDFFMNRPFAYIIRDASSGTVLFAGRVVKL